MVVAKGRPRSADIDRRILEVVAELAVEVGYSRVTVEEIARRAGTSKPAFYRRFPDIASTVPILLATRFGTDNDVDTGSVVTDFLEIQIRQCELFNDPLTKSALPGYIDAISTRPEAGIPFMQGYLAPRRAYTRVVLDKGRERGEIEHYEDSDYIADLLTGPVIMRGFLPGLPPVDAYLIRKTMDTTLDEIGYSGDRSALDNFSFPPA